MSARRRVLGSDDPDTLESLSNLGTLLKEEGRVAEAEPYLRAANVQPVGSATE